MTLGATIDAQEVTLERIWRPEMSLSSARVGGRDATYCIRVEKEQLTRAIVPVYESCIAELKQDDDLVGETDFFGEAGYPPLESLFEMPELFAQVLDTYFKDELFAAVLRPSDAGPGTYAVEGVGSVRVSGEHVFIEGPCYAF